MNESYNPNKNQISHHLECLNCILDECNSEYENLVLTGDFNVNVNESSMKGFCNLNGFKCLINEPTCFKNSEKPPCFDLIVTNRSTLEIGFSDFHLLTVTEFNMDFTKSKPGTITYRDYKNFSNNSFRSEIQSLC